MFWTGNDINRLYTTKVDKAAARVNEADKAVREADRKLKTTWLRLTNKVRRIIYFRAVYENCADWNRRKQYNR